MTTETLVRQDSEAAVVITDAQVDLIRRTIAKEATPEELQLFFYDCRRQGVHPLDRMIHFTKRAGRYTPVTSIDLMRARAAETGECAGIDDPAFSADKDGQLQAATVIVYRITQGTRYPYTATARWTEYFPGEQQGHMWKKMPHTMLGKCAEALALRKAFPKQLSGLYAREEMDQAGGATLAGAVGRVIDQETGEVLDDTAVQPREDGSALVVDIQTATGKSKAGKPWTKHNVVFDDGRSGSTFDEKIREIAEQSKKAGTLVMPTLEQNGQFTNLTNLQLLGLGGGAEPPTPTNGQTNGAGDQKITPAQVGKFHAVAGHHGWTEAERNELLSANGYTTSKDILASDYDRLLDNLKARQATK